MTKSLPEFHQANVTVIGDIMLDHYLYGDVNRISPEAPVPVVNIKNEELLPGGAGNVAINLSAMGVNANIVGNVGNDNHARQLRTQLESVDIHCAFNRSESGTIVKTRVMGSQQQLLRMDFEQLFGEKDWPHVNSLIAEQLSETNVLILSDYNKGTLFDCQAVIHCAREKGIPVLVDPKGNNFSKYRYADLLTPNFSEFVGVVGPVESEMEIDAKAQNLIKDLQLKGLLLTRSENGMTLFRLDEPPYHLPAISKAVTDVTGAGDTVIATVAACLAAGGDIELAVTLSNIAASIVVGKIGTTAVTAPELELAFHKYHQGSGFLSNEQLALAVNLAQQRGEKVVFTNGCFDILHAGHVSYLNQAKSLGDKLVVAINSDESVTKLKGHGRPINSVDRRLAVLQGLESVDWVTSFDGDTPESLLELLKPSVLVKGGDYTPDQVVGKEIVLAYGGEVRVMGVVEECSTTRIIEKARVN